MQLFLLLDHFNPDIIVRQSGKCPFCYPLSAHPVLESQVELKTDANSCVEVIIPSVYSCKVGGLYLQVRGWLVDWLGGKLVDLYKSMWSKLLQIITDFRYFAPLLRHQVKMFLTRSFVILDHIEHI